MNKKNTNSAFFTLAVVGLFSLFTLNIFAQKTDSVKSEQLQSKCFGKLVLPSSISVNNEAFGDFIKVASLTAKERRLLFSKQSNEQKASFVKVNLALQFVKRPNMTKEQQEFVLDAISKVSADIYDKSDSEKIRRSEQNGREVETRALGLFAYKELGDFIEPLMTNKDEEVALLQKYEDLLKNGMKARRKIVKEMPANDRVNIWRTQLAYHLATGKFSKVQNEFILEMLTSLSPETFASRAYTKEEEDKANEMLVSGILNVFTKEEGFAIFMSLGIQKYVKDEPIAIDSLRPATCDCNWYCSQGACAGPNGCESSPIGDCGPFGTTRCNNLCT